MLSRTFISGAGTATLAAALLLTLGCASAAQPDHDTPARPMLAPTTPCATLAGTTLPASAIDLPTRGATITSATLIAATPEVIGTNGVTHPVPEHCSVLGSIHPVDPAAPAINFQVNVPTLWNQKTIQVGGGGLNGSIPRNLAVVASSGSPISAAFPPDAEYPISRGYAMFGGDSGHQDPSNNATWALNAEAWENFGHAALKKTHDAAFAVIRVLYGKKPKVSYFMGQSQGGREALEVAQRYPKDYDGVVATSPLIGYTAHVVHKTLLATVQTGAGWIAPAKYGVIAAEVMRQCDALDGLNDGVISHYMGCAARFDPLKSGAQPFAAIRCAGGADTGNTCVSDVQIATLNQMHTPTNFGYALANGWTTFPGYGVGREAFSGWLTVTPQPSTTTQPALGQPGATLSYGILKNPSFNLVHFDLATFANQVRAASAVIDSTNPDLNVFFAHGGRLIIKTQSSDYSSNPHTVMQYYEALVSKFGQRRVDRHVRLYVMANGDHNGSGQSTTSGETIPQFVDLVSLSTDWVENDATPPDAPELSAKLRLPPYTTLSTRPLCRYPLFPRYAGGDAKLAASFRCSAD